VVRRNRQDCAALSLTSVFNRASWAFLPVALLALGCTRLNPDYCDSTTRCSGGRACDLGTSTCKVPDAATQPDAGPDVPDLAGDLGDARNSCAVDDDCAAADAGPACVLGQCKRCMAAGDCKAGLVCAPDTGRCVECTATAGCLGTSASAVCVSSKCVPCTQQPDACKVRYPEAPVCNATGQCVGCLQSARDCSTANRPLCGAGNTCVACSGDASCAQKDPALTACDPGGACVECTADKYCANPTRPICDLQSKKCVPCRSDSQCFAKQGSVNPAVCMAHQDGRCATDAEVVYVHYTRGCAMSAAAGNTAAGTAAMPFCYTQNGINAVTASRRVVVLRGPDPLTPFTAAPTGEELTVIGQLGATILPGAVSGIRLTAGALYLRGVTISASFQSGVVAENGATLRMNRCIVTGNSGGLQVAGAGFDIANSIFAANKGALAIGTGTTFGGVYLKSAPGKPAVFRNNTLVDNEAIGVVCAEPFPVKNLLVAGNAVEQVFGCTVTSSKVGVSPAFDPMKPYHLTAASPCVNAGDPMDFPPDDLDGDARPLPAGSLSDCGADELAP